jgi:hypothetical protein
MNSIADRGLTLENKRYVEKNEYYRALVEMRKKKSVTDIITGFNDYTSQFGTVINDWIFFIHEYIV